jgi:hypothetical protein
LKTKKLVKIDEYNAAHVSQLREDLFYSSSWSMLFEDKASRQEIAALRGFLTFFGLVCQESSTALPLLTVAENHLKKSLLLPAS